MLEHGQAGLDRLEKVLGEIDELEFGQYKVVQLLQLERAQNQHAQATVLRYLDIDTSPRVSSLKHSWTCGCQATYRLAERLEHFRAQLNVGYLDEGDPAVGGLLLPRYFVDVLALLGLFELEDQSKK